MNSTVSWSECRDSNSRPLEPHSSAIPNFATPGSSIVSLSLGDFDILAHLSKKCKCFFHYFSKFFKRIFKSHLSTFFQYFQKFTNIFNVLILKAWAYSRIYMNKPTKTFRYSPRPLETTLPIFHRWATAFSASAFSFSLVYST